LPLTNEDTLALSVNHTGVFAEIGRDVAVVTGPCENVHEYRPQSDFIIDAGFYRRFLDQWLEDGQGALDCR
jgi:hypothetical protein